MSRRDSDDLFLVKKWHLYVVFASALSFIAGMTVRSLLLGPTPVYVMGTIPSEDVPAPTSTVAGPGTSSSPGTAQPSPTVAVVSVSADDDPGLGPTDAAVLIVEFSDFQCFYCARFATETLGQILNTYGDSVRLVYRDFPLTSIHPQAQKAAEAAQCAHEEGKYWEYHDLLFQNQQALDVVNLKAYAEKVGLDTEAFDDCLDSGRFASEVSKDLTDGQVYGVTATPTFFINGRLVRGAQPFSVFQALIEEELAKQQQS
jgi:protein-disulfide isomerase